VITWEDPEVKAMPRWMGMGDIKYGAPMLGNVADLEGDEVGAIVAAESEELCEEALRLLKIDWEELPQYTDPLEAMKPGAAALQPEFTPQSNVFQTSKYDIGNVDEAFKKADHVVEYDSNFPQWGLHHPNPATGVAWWEQDQVGGEGNNVWTNTARSGLGPDNPYDWQLLTIAITKVANELGMDPIEVTLKNVSPSINQLKQCIEVGKKAINWDQKWHAPGTKKLPNGKMHGIAFRYHTIGRGGGNIYACTVNIKADGKVYMPLKGPWRGVYAEDATVKQKYSALAQSANRVASPTIRFMGTIGGNICQLHRCWYFRNHDNRFNCTRKGGKTCFAMAGDNRYHSILGAVDGCIAVHPSDIAPALVALNAKIVTSKKRSINAQDFWAVKGPQSTILAVDEIVTEIQIPSAPAGSRSAFLKFALRKSIDFPIVNCAALVSRDTTRICLNAVAPIPYRAVKAEETIAGEAINEGNAEAAGEAAVSAAKPFPATKYKVQIAKIMVKRTLLACA
jgi:xanthine dehydrogenase YagS FAD-binding subunit